MPCVSRCSSSLAAQRPRLGSDTILPDEMFSEQAERRVKLGLVVAEMISQYELSAEPAKVREAIEDIASTYQDPKKSLTGITRKTSSWGIESAFSRTLSWRSYCRPRRSLK